MDIEMLNQYNWQKKSLSWWGKGTTSLKRKKKAWEEKSHSIYFYTIIYSSTILRKWQLQMLAKPRLCYSWELNNSSMMQRYIKWRHGGHMKKKKKKEKTKQKKRIVNEVLWKVNPSPSGYSEERPFKLSAQYQDSTLC